MISDNYSIEMEKSHVVNMTNLRVAIVHDFLLYPGGAEKVLIDIVEAFPDAPIYTLLYDVQKMKKYFNYRI